VFREGISLASCSEILLTSVTRLSEPFIEEDFDTFFPNLSEAAFAIVPEKTTSWIDGNYALNTEVWSRR